MLILGFWKPRLLVFPMTALGNWLLLLSPSDPHMKDKSRKMACWSKQRGCMCTRFFLKTRNWTNIDSHIFSLPKFAVPVMILILNRTFGKNTQSLDMSRNLQVLNRIILERTPSGKIIKADLRKLARKQWELRSMGGSGKTSRQPLANL